MDDCICPLCECQNSSQVHRDSARPYLRCAACSLIFVPPSYRLDPTAEKARYDLHRNDPQDGGYRGFLAPLAGAIVRNTTAGSEGLDFGCGPERVLASMLRESGRATAVYDPFYAPGEEVWSRSFDFIASSETFEHLYNPRLELERLFRVLRPGGILAVMTAFLPPLDGFAHWHYISDPTHVCFYSRSTFEYIASHWHAHVAFEGDRIALLRHAREKPNIAASFNRAKHVDSG